MTLVTVIIPTYNRAQKLLRAVKSVLNQDFRDFELIIVDDGSTDKTVQILGPYMDKLRYVFQPNKGPSAARNRGVRESRGQYLAFLDSDDYWLPKKLQRQVEFFKQNPSAAICQTDELWFRKGRRVNPKKIHLKPSGYIFEPCLRLCLISPSAVMLTRSLFHEVGGFDERLPACEDYDLWLRITSAHPVYLLEEALVIKEGGHADQLSAKFWGMDRFRIYAIVKILLGHELLESQKKAAIQELARKCHVYARGCEKRGRIQEALFFRGLPNMVDENPKSDLIDKIISYFK